MACPNKEKDQEILREISERNTKKTVETPYNLVDVTWEGSLLDIQRFVTDLNNVLYLTKLSDGNYVATIIDI